MISLEDNWILSDTVRSNMSFMHWASMPKKQQTSKVTIRNQPSITHGWCKPNCHQMLAWTCGEHVSSLISPQILTHRPSSTSTNIFTWNLGDSHFLDLLLSLRLSLLGHLQWQPIGPILPHCLRTSGVCPWAFTLLSDLLLWPSTPPLCRCHRDIPFCPADLALCYCHISDCLAGISTWMSNRFLNLNPFSFLSTTIIYISMNVNGTTIQPTPYVHFLASPFVPPYSCTSQPKPLQVFTSTCATSLLFTLF